MKSWQLCSPLTAGPEAGGGARHSLRAFPAPKTLRGHLFGGPQCACEEPEAGALLGAASRGPALGVGRNWGLRQVVGFDESGSPGQGNGLERRITVWNGKQGTRGLGAETHHKPNPKGRTVNLTLGGCEPSSKTTFARTT